MFSFENGQKLLSWTRGRGATDRRLVFALGVLILALVGYLVIARGTNVGDIGEIAKTIKDDRLAALVLVSIFLLAVWLAFRLIFQGDGPPRAAEDATTPATEAPDITGLVLRIDPSGGFVGGLDAARPVLARIYDGEPGKIAVIDEKRVATAADVARLEAASVLSAEQYKCLNDFRGAVASHDAACDLFGTALGLFRGGGDPLVTRDLFPLLADELRFAVGLASRPPERTVKATLVARDWPRKGPGSEAANTCSVFLTREELEASQSSWERQLSQYNIVFLGDEYRRLLIPVPELPSGQWRPRLLAPVLAHLIPILARLQPVADLNWKSFSRDVERIRPPTVGRYSLADIDDWVLLLPRQNGVPFPDRQTLLSTSLPPTGSELIRWLEARGGRTRRQ